MRKLLDPGDIFYTDINKKYLYFGYMGSSHSKMDYDLVFNYHSKELELKAPMMSDREYEVVGNVKRAEDALFHLVEAINEGRQFNLF